MQSLGVLMARIYFGLIFCLATFCTAEAGENPRALKWFAGDCDVLVWPTAKFTAADRARQAATGGLSWMVVCSGVRGRALIEPGALLRLAELRTGDVNAIGALRWHAPVPISEDVICLGIEPDLPLPRPGAQDVIDWTNALGGATILASPGRKLERYADTLARFTAFEAFHGGKWNPECAVGGAWDKLLAAGRRVCIVGGSSDRTRPVLGRGACATYVLCRSNAEADIVAAIRAGRVVVAERDNIRLNFTVNGAPPGSVVKPEGDRVAITIGVEAREKVDEVKVIGNAGAAGAEISVLRTLVLGAKRTSQTFTLRLGRTTRYLRAVAVIHKGACRTMTNPVFIGPHAPGPMAPHAREEQSRLISMAVKKLDWSDEARARAILDKLLDHRDTGPCAAVVLGRTFSKKQLDRIRPLLESPRPSVRALAAYILIRVEGEAALPNILPLLKDEASVPRVYAARTLARFAKQEHLELALRASRDSRREVRQYGLASLARIPCKKSLLRLRKALDDPVPAVRHAARTQLDVMLSLESGHEAQFIDAFKTGKLDSKLLEVAVTRAELRPLVREAVGGTEQEAEEAKPEHPPGEGQPGFRSLSAAQTKQPPEIDGLGKDKVWEGIRPAGEFVLADGNPAAHHTTVRAVYDQEALYLLVECVEPQPQQIVANEKSRDSHVWVDDSVDIYICPAGSREKEDPTYYRFSVNSLGVKFDEQRRSRHWNADWDAAASVGKDSWTIEVALPFRSLRVGSPTNRRTRWLINVVRHRRVKPEEESSFSPGNPRAPGTYAELRFE